MDVDEALDRLYAAPLDEFTATRNALAKELGKDGAQIKSLKKPNLAAWALNQLSRRHASELQELFEATHAVRLAQRRVLSGGKASALREATETRGRVVTKLTTLAGEILTNSGHAAAPATLSAITSSFIAIASGEEAAEALRTGRLTRELHASSDTGFAEGGGLTLVGSEAEEETEEDMAGRAKALRAAVNDARERAQAASKAVREAEQEVAERVRESDEADRAAKAAREAAEFARRAVEARRTESEEAETALEAAEKAFREAD
ncbi:MAG TPA: hypothetical protein VFA34_00015 [Actinomycetota bacterium]|jgi:hypothetical protein|nr:hypothetical protein [Actinomycetota bacterium]